MADALGSGPSARKGVQVQVLSSTPENFCHSATVAVGSLEFFNSRVKVADALGSGPSARKGVQVQVLSSTPENFNSQPLAFLKESRESFE